MCVCVCETHRKETELPTVFVCSREQFIARWQFVLSFAENSPFQHFTKEKRDFLVYRTRTVFTKFQAHLAAYVSSDELRKAGIACY